MAAVKVFLLSARPQLNVNVTATLLMSILTNQSWTDNTYSLLPATILPDSTQIQKPWHYVTLMTCCKFALPLPEWHIWTKANSNLEFCNCRLRAHFVFTTLGSIWEVGSLNVFVWLHSCYITCVAQESEKTVELLCFSSWDRHFKWGKAWTVCMPVSTFAAICRSSLVPYILTHPVLWKHLDSPHPIRPEGDEVCFAIYFRDVCSIVWLMSSLMSLTQDMHFAW